LLRHVHHTIALLRLSNRKDPSQKSAAPEACAAIAKA